MSKRTRFLKIKDWEIDGLRSFCAKLAAATEGAEAMEFYYSFVMPKLGKEFDLLRVGQEEIVNIELKSGNVSDEAIKKQLLQNRYYLATLGHPAYFFTYVSSADRLLRLTGSGRLVEAAWDELVAVLHRQTDCYDGPIEELFREDLYLISPLTDPDRFLRGDYFLTNQQRDIRRVILKNLTSGETPSVQGFTGFPGTGKTILLYDIAMQLSEKERVCLFHLGPHTKELDQLNSRLKRIDFYYEGTDPDLLKERSYHAICVDEGHRMTQALWEKIRTLSEIWQAPIILSYNREDAFSEKERGTEGAVWFEREPGFHGYRLTNRIRLNNELAVFIRSVMHPVTHHRDFPSVSLSYANSGDETMTLISCLKEKGFTFITLPEETSDMPEGSDTTKDNASALSVLEAGSKEFDRVVMVIGSDFYYDEDGYLRNRTTTQTHSAVRDLFHGLSRAKKHVALIVEDNMPVFDILLAILQK
ncbi:MAG: ATP-binding protein [Lachnospiraceae bacterium]|nr:ATP-binding protein [Lachnospiraceae bacterium]